MIRKKTVRSKILYFCNEIIIIKKCVMVSRRCCEEMMNDLNEGNSQKQIKKIHNYREKKLFLRDNNYNDNKLYKKKQNL